MLSAHFNSPAFSFTMNPRHFIALGLFFFPCLASQARTTAFTYQGHLLDMGSSPFGTSDRFIELAVRPFGSTEAYTVLAPRQRITAAPFAVRSIHSSFALIATQASSLSGTLTASNIPSNLITGTMLANGAVGSAQPAAQNVGASQLASESIQALAPTGVVSAFAGTTPPAGWMMCDGTSNSRTAKAVLVAVIGTSHGAGDGSSTFNLPDYRGRFLRGVDEGTGRAPEAVTRTPMSVGGNAVDAVGTTQEDQFKSHSHSPGLIADLAVASGGSTLLRNIWKYSAGEIDQTHPSGGTETRPKNATVHFIIKL
jgi:hypothetical protein